MNGTQITGANSFNDISRPERAHSSVSPSRIAGFMHPDDVMATPRLTHAEKREVLASWASDIHAVPDAPTLRQLDNGAVVRVEDVLRALQCLNDDQNREQRPPGLFWPLTGLRICFPNRLNSVLRGTWSGDDDDDPPPCPAMIARPFGGPRSGGEAVDPGLAMAA